MDNDSAVAPSQDAKNIALLVWIGTIFFGFLPPLIVFLIKKDEPYVYDQSREALNWSITAMIAGFISGILCMVLIGFVLLPAVGICNLVFCIMGAIAASEGKPFRVPFALRLIK